VTDWEDIKKLVSYHRLTPSEREATKIAIEAGIDMSMVPFGYSFSELLLDLVVSGEIPESRIDESVERILRVKEDLGLFEDPYPPPVPSEEARQVLCSLFFPSLWSTFH